MGEVIMIMIDELRDEIEVARYTLQMDLDEDEFEVWKDRKVQKAEERYPETQGFYFETAGAGATPSGA